MVDFNAEIRTKQEEEQKKMSNYGLGRWSETREKFINYLEPHNLYDINTFFEKRNSKSGREPIQRWNKKETNSKNALKIY